MKWLIWLVALVSVGEAPARAEPVEEFVEAYAKQHEFHGVVAIGRGGKRTYAKGFGWANLAFKVPSTVEGKYKIASITKLFTSTLILQLRDRGKLGLDKTIKVYLPSYAGPAGDKVTVQELLDHTSGIDNMDKVKSAAEAIRDGLPAYQTPWTTDQLLAKFCSGPLVHAPGTKFDYNNADYVILGKIIEQVYGKPYEQVVKEQILDPLHMVDTGMAHADVVIPGLADTYFMTEDHRLMPDLPVYPEYWYAAGGMYSTAQDLLTFANALFSNKLISAASLALMIKPGLDDYGFGAWTYDATIGGKKYHIVKRPGQIMGAQGQFYHFMAPDLTIIILSNVGNTDLDELVAQIGKRSVP